MLVVRAWARLRWIKVYVETIPIPQISEDKQPFIKLVDKIIKAKTNNSAADTGALETEIDQLVYLLYNLTSADIKIIEGD